MIANILAPLDGSPLAERALAYAAALARATQSRLRLIHVMPDIPPQVRPWKEVDVAARLEQLAGQLCGQGIQATARTVVGRSAAATIVEAAEELPADLIVMSTHGSSGIGRWLYGSVADKVLSQAKAPVLLVPASCRHPWPTDRALTVLVPLDGSDFAEAALGPSRAFADSLGARLLLLRVVEQQPDIVWRFDPVGVTIQRATPEQEREARDYLDGIATSASVAAPAMDVIVDEGDPATVIAAIARQEGVDLIAMATHGRTGLARLTMGSVATTTLQRAHVPILLVRPAGLAQAQVEATSAAAAAPTDIRPPVGTP